MADRIVQLKDKNGDKIYPVSGGIGEGVIDSSALASGSVTADKLASNSVISAKIADGAVTSAKIANGAVTSAKLTFPIKRAAQGSWISARDNAVVMNNNANRTGGYAPVVDVKTKSGDWSIGNIDNGDYLYFSYATDANYNAGNNTSNSHYLAADGNNSFIPNMAKVVTYTTTDPGKNSTLAANRFVAVYEN